MANRTILVLGATGQQGGATAAELLANGWQVRAYTRDSSSEAAKRLLSAGAQLIEGDMGDRASLDAAMQGVYGVFSVQPPEWSPSDEAAAEEIRLGRNVADSALEAGVRHFVYSSVGGADRQARFRKLAKRELEQYVESLTFPKTTVLRPAGFMESYANPLFGIADGTLVEATEPDVPVKLIAVDDIGVFARLAFEHPGSFAGRTIELAGDELTPRAVAAAIGRAVNRPIRYVRLPIETVRSRNEIMARLYEWLNGEGYEADIPGLRKLHPGLMNVETWLERKGKAIFETMFRNSR